MQASFDRIRLEVQRQRRARTERFAQCKRGLDLLGHDSMTQIDASALPADPHEALRELVLWEGELERLRRAAVEAAGAHGASWEQIGVALGMSRQAAWDFYTRQARNDLALGRWVCTVGIGGPESRG